MHCKIYKDTLRLYIFTFRTFDLVYDLSLVSFHFLYPDCSISFHVLDNLFSVKPNSKLLVQKFHKLLFIRFLLLFVFFNHLFLLLKFGCNQVLFRVQCIILFLHLFLFSFLFLLVFHKLLNLCLQVLNFFASFLCSCFLLLFISILFFLESIELILKNLKFFPRVIKLCLELVSLFLKLRAFLRYKSILLLFDCAHGRIGYLELGYVELLLSKSDLEPQILLVLLP